jgi:2-haloacid dehalogenase
MFKSFPIQALTFDVFGTVVNVRSTLIDELKLFGLPDGITGQLADDWKNEYANGVERVKNAAGDESAWKNADQLIRDGLNVALSQNHLQNLTESDRDELLPAWHRLKPWNDSLSGMQRLRSRFKLVALANANASLLADIAYHAGLPWYMIISAEEVKRYKPDPLVYQRAICRLGLRPDEIMMVASHLYDLDGAKEAGMMTAFVKRAEELSGDGKYEPDVTVTDFNDLAAKLIGVTGR